MQFALAIVREQTAQRHRRNRYVAQQDATQTRGRCADLRVNAACLFLVESKAGCRRLWLKAFT